MKEKKMDIAFMCQFFYPEYISSATLPWDTATVLSKCGYKVGALCGYPKEYLKDKNIPLKETVENVYIRRLKYAEFSRKSIIGRIINYFSFTASCMFNISELRKYKSVIVYSNPPVLPIVALMAKKILKLKLVFVCYDVYPEIAQATGIIKSKGFIASVMRFINKKLYKNSDKVVALSNEMKQYLLNNRCIEERKIEVIPNWFKDEIKNDYNVNNEQLSNFKKDDDFVISYFGNMGICQDIKTIVDAIRKNKNPHIKFLFAGHGNKVAKLKEIVELNKLENVLILDFLHGNDFEYAQKISDCFLVSLVDGLSGLCVPSKTYSYMSEGKPIIAILNKETDIAKDLIENNAGFVCKNGESDRIIEYIDKLHNEPDLKHKMSENCRNVFTSKYTEQICTGHYVEMFKELLDYEVV